jgi:hypothetical protein
VGQRDECLAVTCTDVRTEIRQLTERTQLKEIQYDAGMVRIILRIRKQFL